MADQNLPLERARLKAVEQSSNHLQTLRQPAAIAVCKVVVSEMEESLAEVDPIMENPAMETPVPVAPTMALQRMALWATVLLSMVDSDPEQTVGTWAVEAAVPIAEAVIDQEDWVQVWEVALAAD